MLLGIERTVMYWSRMPNPQTAALAKRKKPIDARCLDCRYYLAFETDPEDQEDDDDDPDPDAATGFCRRYPPLMVLSYPVATWSRAEVPETWWCGEFHPAEQP